MRATLKDVAGLAGVSRMAASVVLNGTKQRISVSPEKAELIREAARKLGYRPNPIAQALKGRGTRQIALVFQNFFRFSPSSSYRSDLMNGVMEALFPRGYTLSLCPRLILEGDPAADGRFDGVLWCRPEISHDEARRLQSATTPIVLMHAPPGSVLGVPSFCADNDSAMRRVVQHLHSLGHRRICYVIDPVSERTVEGAARLTALEAAAIRMELPPPDLLVLPQDHSILSRYREADAPHTALVCFSDELAGFVLRSCASLSVRVPEHVSVVGFDSSSLCEQTSPRLTSPRQPVEIMARDACLHLISLIEAENADAVEASTSTLYDCALDVRESTGPARTH